MISPFKKWKNGQVFLYRHFPPREELIKEFQDWGMKHGFPDVPSYTETLKDLHAWVENTIPLFVEHFPAMRVMYVAHSVLQINEVYDS